MSRSMNTTSEAVALSQKMAVGDHEKGVAANGYATSPSSDNLSYGKEEIFTLESLDPALNAKMHLVNNVRSYQSLVCHSML